MDRQIYFTLHQPHYRNNNASSIMWVLLAATNFSVIRDWRVLVLAIFELCNSYFLNV